MDFVTLANAAHRSSRAIVRLLTEEGDDDDFAQLESVGSSRHSGPGWPSTPDAAPARGGGGGGDAYVDYPRGAGGGMTGVPNLGSRPLLSPTAETALLSLCTNFLLYVAMVLITVMVARIYFPTWLEPREEPDHAWRSSSARTYMNVVETASFSDEEDDGEDGGEGDFVEGGGRRRAREVVQGRRRSIGRGRGGGTRRRRRRPGPSSREGVIEGILFSRLRSGDHVEGERLHEFGHLRGHVERDLRLVGIAAGT